MTTVWLNSGLRQAAISLISGYQKYLSPHKGFSCAHRVLYGGESCSQYVKRLIAKKDLAAALKASQQRFRDCRAANQIIKSSHNTESEPENLPDNPPQKPPKNRLQNQDNCAAMLDPSCCECGMQSLDCGSSFPTDLSSCDIANCGDGCSGMDCSGFDCSGVDCCGGCG